MTHPDPPPEAIPPELLGRLLDRHAAALEFFARQWTGAADDVVQEAFVRLAGQAVCPENPLAWLYRAVRNGAISAARAEGRRQRHEAAAREERKSWFEPTDDTKLDSAAAAEALAQLPLAEREIIVAHLWGRLTFQQIAELVGTSSSAAHRGYAAGLSRLRELLREPCEPGEDLRREA